MNDNAGPGNLLQAAVHDRINTLCRQAYVHELRGGLQAIHSSMELMARATAVADASFAAKASELAKRAIATHENAITRVLDEIIARRHDPQPVDLGALARDCVQFLQNPAAARGITLLLDAEDGLVIHARRQPLRTSILGVILSALRGMPDGSRLRLAALRRDHAVVLRFDGLSLDAASAVPEPAALASTDVLSADLDGLILPVVRQVIADDGGHTWTETDSVGGGVLSIAYPSA